MKFLKDNWIWIVTPVALFTLVTLLIIFAFPESSEADPNIYHLK